MACGIVISVDRKMLSVRLTFAVNVSELATLFVAVTARTSGAVTVDVAIGNVVVVAFVGNVTVAGMDAPFVGEQVMFITTPPLGALPLIVRVPVVPVPPTREFGLTESPMSDGLFTVSETLALELLYAPVITAGVLAAVG
jgi:hypothetical protein